MANFVHFTTENERNNAVLSKRAKTVVIPLGMVFEPFIEYKKSYSYYDLRLIYISRINRKKGLDLLLNALCLLPSYLKDRVSLDIYGEDDDNFLQELKNIVELNQLRKCVVFKGKLNPQNRNETLQQYDVLALTSHQENFGLVVAEALDQKIPVLISNKVNLCDVVEQNQCGWVSSLKVENIAKKIEEAFRTPKHIRQQMGEKGHAFVRENYAFEKVGVNYWQLYEKIVGR
jgi:glycosyltransferase involved in cell wall biosynthesis